MHGKKKIFIVVINWNKKDLTIKCLSSLKKAIVSNKNISVVLVDNNSTDASYESFYKLRFSFEFTFIQNKKNLGWTGANNVGIKFALKNNADCVLLLANDSRIRKGSIENLVNKLFSDKNIGIVGPKIYKYKSDKKIIANAGNFFDYKFQGKDLGRGEVDKGQYDNKDETDYVSGTAPVIKSDVFKKIGYFDDQLFIYYEDVDFCMRAKKAGFKCYFVQNATVYHMGAATTIVGSPLHTYYNTRNRLIFLIRYAPLITFIPEVFRLGIIALRFIKRRRESDKYALIAIRDFLLGRFGERNYWNK